MRSAETRRTIDSPVGPLHLAARAAGLSHLLFARADPPPGDGSEAARATLDLAEAQLAEYFAGRRREFSVPLAAEGTEFQRAVWAALLDIPFGQTWSYSDLARRIGKPSAVRAVGAANGKNPISIIVPCHRVIGADGTLTGYGGGVTTKERLLRLEGWAPPEQLSLGV
jgi:methylated-DNA-[protein]-cysteine S-methyltransferase